MSKNLDINTIIILGVLILVVLLVCLKCINIQKNITEQFQDVGSGVANALEEVEKAENMANELKNMVSNTIRTITSSSLFRSVKLKEAKNKYTLAQSSSNKKLMTTEQKEQV